MVTHLCLLPLCLVGAAAGFQISSRFTKHPTQNLRHSIVKYLRHFTKYPTQNFGDSILNSLESPLSKIIPSSPTHPPHHACYHLQTISTSVYRPAALAAAEVECVRHFTKYPTQTLVDSSLHLHSCFALTTLEICRMVPFGPTSVL